MSIASHFVPPVSLDNIEDEPVQRVKCREPGWKRRGKHHPVSKKKKKTTRKQAEERRTSDVRTVIIREKNTMLSTGNSCFRGPSSMAVCYGLLVLLSIGCVSAPSQGGPIAVVLSQPATIGDRSVIECKMEPAPKHCLSMYWNINGHDIHSGPNYDIFFIDQFCLGYLTYNVCTDAEIKCVVELPTVNLNSSNRSSETVTIRLPETEELHTTELMDNDVFGGEPESNFNDTSRNNTLDTDIPTVTRATNEQEKNRENMESNLASISVVTVVLPLFLGAMLLFCCCVKKCPCYRRRTTQLSVRFSRRSKSSVQNAEKQSASEKAEPTYSDGGIQETDQNAPKFEVPGDRTSTTTGDVTTKKKNHPVHREQRGLAQLRTHEGKEDENFASSHDAASSYMQPVPQLVQDVLLNPDQFEIEVPLEEICLASNFDHVAIIEINSPLQNNAVNHFRALAEPVY